MSQKTSSKMKLRIAQAMKDLARTKTFDKITIRDIIEACDINRSTFYNHFVDKYDLIEWIYKTDISAGFVEAAPEEWLCNATLLLKVWHDEKWFYKQAIKTEGPSSLRDILFKTTYQHTKEYITNYLQGKQISEQSRHFICAYQAYAFMGMHISYMENGAEEDPDIFAQRLFEISERGLCGAIDKSLELDELQHKRQS